MNKCTKSKLSGILGLLTMCSAAVCQTADVSAQMYVGYVNPQEDVYPYSGFNNSSNEDLTLYFVIRVEASKFDNLNGASLTGMRIGWSQGGEETFPETEVFVREELDGENLASGKDQMCFGWNNVMFDAPYTITSGKDLYLGAKVEWPKGAWLGTGTWGYKLPENCQYMANQEDAAPDGKLNWIDATDNSAVIMALGIVEASGDQFNNIAVLSDILLNDVQPLQYPGDAWLTIKNDGLNDLQDIEITSSLGEKTWTYPVQFSSAIAPGEQKDVSGGLQALGTGLHRIWISKVNGKDVEKPYVLERELIGVPEEVASQYVRRPLIERWVSESDHHSPVYTDDIFIPGIEQFRDRVSVVAHHFSDQFMIFNEFDADIDSEDIKFLVDFANGDKYRVSVPSFSADRSFLPRNPLSRSNKLSVAYSFIYPDFVAPVYMSALDVPTFASMSATATVEDNNCVIDVAGKVEPGIMPEGEPLYLTVYLVEDKIESNSQEFPDDPEVEERYKGIYTHQDVIRVSLTEMYGEKLDGEGEYSKSFTCELEPEWNKDNMRVLAFLNRSGERYGHMQVINSVENGITYNSVGTVADGMRKNFTVRNGSIEAAPGSRVEVFNLDGVRVDCHGLCPGIYVVKVAGADGVAVSKVTVK